MVEIIKDGIILARHIKKEDIKRNLIFFSKDHEFIQVGTWNYEAGKVLDRHYHNEIKREVNKTYEVIIVIQGKIQADIYDLNNTLVKSIEVNEGETLVQLNSGHGYKILKDDTLVVEVKNGPYLGAELDRTRF